MKKQGLAEKDALKRVARARSMAKAKPTANSNATAANRDCSPYSRPFTRS